MADCSYTRDGLRGARKHAAARLLDAIHGDIGRLDEAVGIPGVRRINRNSDAAPDVDTELAGAELKGPRKRGSDLLGDALGIFAFRDVEQDHREFVAPDTGHRVRFADLVTDSLCN